MALRFAGKEKSASEILSLLAQKGIEADVEEIHQKMDSKSNLEQVDINDL